MAPASRLRSGGEWASRDLYCSCLAKDADDDFP